MAWQNKVFSVCKQEDRKIITIFGIKLKIRRSVWPKVNCLFEQNKQILCQLAYFQARDFFMQHYRIKIPAECCGRGSNFELVKIKLKDIKRKWENGEVYSLDQTSPYHYLQSRDTHVYRAYLDDMVKIKYHSAADCLWSLDTFHRLETSIASQGYNPSDCAIAVDKDNAVIDGLHRSCLLLQRFGPEHEIQVVRVS